MSIKVCRCTHRKESHLVVDTYRVNCKECDCARYSLHEEFIRPYSKTVIGAYRSDITINHLARCGISQKIACLYAVSVPIAGVVRIGKTVNLVYRWASRLSEWPSLPDLRLIAAIPNAQKHEDAVHEYFSDLRIRSEWFSYHQDIEALGSCKTESDLLNLLKTPRKQNGRS